MTLSVLVPIPITDAMLISSTAPETDYAAYSAVTSYAVGGKCISTTTHKIYESMVAANLNHDPTDINNRTGTTSYWYEVSATNKWKMFDSEANTQTAIASPLTLVLKPGFFNGIALFGLEATGIAITVKDATGGNVIYSYSGSLENSAPGDYYEYWFSAFLQQADIVISNVDQYNAAEITVTLTSGGTVKCGLLALGDMRPLGDTEFGAKAKPKTFSYIGVDSFGNNKIIRRKSAKDMSLSARLPVDDANRVLQTITELLDVPCVWVGSEASKHSGLRVLGLGSGEISYDQVEDCLLTLNIQGII